MTTKVDVLDHGFVRLVSYMQPVPDELITHEGISYVRRAKESWTGDLEIVRNARVSYDEDWRTGEKEGKDKGLLRYMYRNHHTSPFEAMVFTFEIKVPFFVARQWHRHRTWSYNEVSARYTELPEEFYVPKPEHIGKQSETDKQARDLSAQNIVAHDGTLESTAEWTSHWVSERMTKAHDDYHLLLEKGVPRELARIILPLATYTRFFGTVNLHNLMHFIRLRSDSHAQWEIQQYSNALIELIKPICPIVVGFLIDELAK